MASPAPAGRRWQNEHLVIGRGQRHSFVGRGAEAPGLTLELEEQAEETIIHCSGTITGESAEIFQDEIRSRLIPDSRGKGVAVNCRIVLDLSNVTYVDSSGLGALVAVWTAAQRRSCDVEIANLSRRVERLVTLTKLDQVLNGMRNMLGSAEKPQ